MVSCLLTRQSYFRHFIVSHDAPHNFTKVLKFYGGVFGCRKIKDVYLCIDGFCGK